MALSEHTHKQIDAHLTSFCDTKIPAHARGQVRLTFKVWSNSVSLTLDRVAPQKISGWTKQPIAQFRFDTLDQHWRLFCIQRGSASDWTLYPEIQPSKDFDVLVRALDQDEARMFWG